MGKAKSVAVRHSIIEIYESGQTLVSIATEQGLSYGCVQQLCTRYKILGSSGLKPQYSQCGKPYPDNNDFVYRAVKCLRTWHPRWGAGKIRAELLASRPQLIVPHIRTIQRWFVHNKQNKCRDKQPRERKTWGKYPHEVWEIDAKEEIQTLEGRNNCWLNIKDEYTGAVIDPVVFPL
jgi:hypothetical protein